MTQPRSGVQLDTSVGYLLKQAATALHAAMEQALAPLGLTVTQYSCLELLTHRPGLSNSDLARGTFVTRQSMNVVLRDLEAAGVVSRPDQAPSGRVLPTTLTPTGRDLAAEASRVVRRVEQRMLTGLSSTDETVVRERLQGFVEALRPAE